MADTDTTEGNVGLAFAMVCGAGACTSVGAGMAFCVNLEVSRAPRACAAHMRRASCPGVAPPRVEASGQTSARCGAAAAHAHTGVARPLACLHTVAFGAAGG